MSGTVEIAGATSAGLAKGTLARADITVGTTAVTATVPTTRQWKYVKVCVKTADAVVSVAINEDPTNAAADPPAAGQWGIGYDVQGQGSEVIPLPAGATTIRLLSDTAATAVSLSLIST